MKPPSNDLHNKDVNKHGGSMANISTPLK